MTRYPELDTDSAVYWALDLMTLFHVQADLKARLDNYQGNYRDTLEAHYALANAVWEARR